MDLAKLQSAIRRLNEAPHSPYITRFAPSPTGYLHLGHILSAMFVWGVAGATRASIILRIEDHDRERSQAKYEASILEDLAWLGLRPHLGVSSSATSLYRQSDHPDRYLAAFNQLKSQGRLYNCHCSRSGLRTSDSTIAPGAEPVYPGHCRSRDLPATGAGVRVIIDDQDEYFDDLLLGNQQQNPAAQCGDFLIRDRRGQWTYQFAVTVDDFHEGVNLIIRGEDLTNSTGRQLKLAKMLGRIDQPLFLHHPLLREEDGQKLSKRFFSKAIANCRASGDTPEELLGYAAHLAGLIARRDRLSKTELQGLFSNE